MPVNWYSNPLPLQFCNQNYYQLIINYLITTGGRIMLTLHHEFTEKLKEITALSNKINKNDTNKILEMMKEHIVEIEERYQNNDEHWTIETADLIVLCYELLFIENNDIDDVFNKCLPRFDIKLKRLAENVT
jgi:phosphoribosyl-ATP pyrophosphohydrolase